jgi:phosphoglycerate kinase
MIAGATKNGVESIVGGGDTLAAIAELKQSSGESLEDAFTFVSTGGGAMLDFLAQGTLPGILALG